jgi:putative transposase
VRCWCLKFGPKYAKRFRCKHRGFGDTFFVDEVFIQIGGKQHYLWRAVDQDGEVVDVLLQTRRNTAAAMRFFKRILKSAGCSPHTIVTDKLRSYGAAHREMGGAWEHDTSQYSNNRCEQSHRPTRSKERGMKMFRSVKRGQRFLNVHAAVYNLFNLGRHLTTANNYRKFRQNSFNEWDLVVL